MPGNAKNMAAALFAWKWWFKEELGAMGDSDDKKQDNAFDGFWNKSYTRYDKFLTGATPFHRLYNRIFWGEMDACAVSEKLMAMIPEDFDGVLLDVPAGTGVFTVKKYASLSKAKEVILMDLSSQMLEKYALKLANVEAPWIKNLVGDVCHIPLEDASVDMVVCMNGIHCFPNKEGAMAEMARVLKPGGKFIGTFYIEGEQKRPDFFIRHIYNKLKIFCAPHYTRASAKARLEQDFDLSTYEVEGSILYFQGTRK